MNLQLPPSTTLLVMIALTTSPLASPGPVLAGQSAAAGTVPRTLAPEPGEEHFGPLTMLTDGGENAEAYFSPDGRQLVFQSTRPPFACDQIFMMPAGGGQPVLISTGRGRTTCAYFTGDGRHVFYSSTHLGSADCPTPPDHQHGYVWPLFADYDIFQVDLVTRGLSRLTDTPGYDAEATLSPDGRRIVFTSLRDGDLDIYVMNADGSDVRRLTHTPGYDGGAFFSPDGTRIVYRALHPTDAAELADYQGLLARDLVRPTRLEIFVMNADGTDQRQVTDLGCASFAPFFHPSGDKIIFSSNYPDPRGREFELFLVDLDGSDLERVTFSEGFDGFPMWAPDGQTFVFCSNRHDARPGQTNVFVTRWRDRER